MIDISRFDQYLRLRRVGLLICGVTKARLSTWICNVSLNQDKTEQDIYIYALVRCWTSTSLKELIILTKSSLLYFCLLIWTTLTYSLLRKILIAGRINGIF
jgi:hypothetical protein